MEPPIAAGLLVICLAVKGGADGSSADVRSGATAKHDAAVSKN
jgi:hypothetical protein